MQQPAAPTVTLLLLSCLPACAEPPAQVEGLTPTHSHAAYAATAAPLTRKVLFIGIDGLRVDSLLAADAPALHGLIARGALHDRVFAGSGLNSNSGSNWSNLLTGVRYSKHNVSTNDFRGHRFAQYPHFFARLAEARPDLTTASIVHWAPINIHVTPPGTDVVASPMTDLGVQWGAALRLLGDDAPDVTFVHFDGVDAAGHAHGFGSAPYLDAIAKVDDRVELVLQALTRRASYGREDWLVVVSTDHGGGGESPKQHGDIAYEVNTRVFMILSNSGPAWCTGHLDGPMNNEDVATHIFAFLGIALDPAWQLDGRPHPRCGAPR